MASPVDTSVKFITENMPGAPVLSGTAGALISVLDALLVTGFGLRTAASVVVAGGVATVTLASNALNANLLHSVILVEGVAAPMADLNGEQRVTAATNTTLQFATAVADGTASGTITIKSAPAGWEKLYSGTNKAVYRSTHVQSAKHCLRVDDTGTTSARVRAYESMSDVDTGVGPFPTDTQFSGGGYWWKSITANATARRYIFAADPRMLLTAPMPNGDYGALASNIRGFGDPIALAPSGDAWATLLSYCSSNYSSLFDTGAYSGSINAPNANSSAACFPRAFSGLGSAVFCRPVSEAGEAYQISGKHSSAGFGPGPSSIDGQIKLARVLMSESASYSAPRCVVPGVLIVPQLVSDAAFLPGTVIDGSGSLAGRKLLSVITGASATASTGLGVAFIDITGPWRGYA